MPAREGPASPVYCLWSQCHDALTDTPEVTFHQRSARPSPGDGPDTVN